MRTRSSLSLLIAVSAALSLGACATSGGGGGRVERGIASFYHRSLEGGATASGEPYDPDELTCAHRKLAFGTRLRVKLVRTGATATCRVNDRGPFVAGRVVDLSAAMAEELGVAGDDIHKVEITVAD